MTIHRLAIIGAGGHGKVVAESAFCRGYRSIIFFDDKFPTRKSVYDFTIVGDVSSISHHLDLFDEVIIACGDNRSRLQIASNLDNLAVKFATIVHPAATVSRFVNIAEGCVVCPGAVINPGAEIGAHCIINTHSLVEHDCILDRGVHISPNASLGGGVRVGELSWIGIGAAIKHNVIIGREAIIGAGAVVVAAVPDNVTVVGVPARPIIR